MTNSKSTKRSLFSSALAILMCVAMLVGITFACFTDTPSMAVNKIQAGTLDIKLQMKGNDDNWVTAEGKTLQFKCYRYNIQIQTSTPSTKTNFN